MQETHIDYNSRIENDKYTWYHSGLNKIVEDGVFSSGVGFVINNKWLNYIKDIKPINDRLITLTLAYKRNLKIIPNRILKGILDGMLKGVLKEILKGVLKGKLKKNNLEAPNL